MHGVQLMAIEKFKGSFKIEKSGCTTLVNKTINYIRNSDALALYTYLSCRPDNWDLNVKQIMSHFEWGRDKTYKSLTKLQDLFLLKKIDHREQGMFIKHEYCLFLRPISPLPENKEVVKTLISI